MSKCNLCGGQTKLWINKLFDDRHGYPGFFDVYRCQNCAIGITNPPLSPKKISRIYTKYYPWHNVDISKINLNDYRSPNAWTNWGKGLNIDCHRQAKPKTKVLDVGCGVGYSLLELKNKDCEAYGIDPEATAEKLAKKFGLKFHRGFIQDHPFGKTKFDYITASQVLEHTPGPIKFLKDCKKRLAPGGQIILSFPNIDSLTRRLLGRRWLHWHVPYHFWHFSRKSLEILTQKSNLKITNLITVSPNMWTNLQLRHLLMPHHPGQRDEFWDGGSNSSPTWLSQSWSLLENHNYLNRVIDALGLGESWVVTLSNP